VPLQARGDVIDNQAVAICTIQTSSIGRRVRKECILPGQLHAPLQARGGVLDDQAIATHYLHHFSSKAVRQLGLCMCRVDRLCEIELLVRRSTTLWTTQAFGRSASRGVEDLVILYSFNPTTISARQVLFSSFTIRPVERQKQIGHHDDASQELSLQRQPK
jgi:hypothetical protein